MKKWLEVDQVFILEKLILINMNDKEITAEEFMEDLANLMGVSVEEAMRRTEEFGVELEKLKKSKDER
jgi:hypothetical protein